MADDPGTSVFQGLIARGYTPIHAAALAGHIQQESGFDPTRVNPREDAHGAVQWRDSRWQALQDFAKARGTSPTDQNTQLDFIGHEMRGTERRAGDKFLAATDLPSASAALKSYIRFGDDSAGTRLTNAQRFLGDQAGMLAPPQPTAVPPMTGGPPAPVLADAAAPPAAPPIPAQDDQTQASLAGIAKMLQQQQPQMATIDPNLLPQATPPMTPAMIRARQMAAAMRARPFGGAA